MIEYIAYDRRDGYTLRECYRDGGSVYVKVGADISRFTSVDSAMAYYNSKGE